MKTIWKFTATEIVDMPEGAEILTVQMQGEDICLWAKVDPTTGSWTKRRFLCLGTGHEIPDENLKYIGTIQTVDRFVWHIFERL